MTDGSKTKVVVIGGGLAGLACAYYLKKRGIDVDVLEKQAVAGGTVRSALKEERYLLDLGPHTFSASSSLILGLARELSIDPLIVGGTEVSRNKYIFRRGKLTNLPTSKTALSKSSALSISGRLRVMSEGLVGGKFKEGESLADYIRRHGGKDMLESFVDPNVLGIFAADIKDVEAEAVIPEVIREDKEGRGSFKKFVKQVYGFDASGLVSFRWGMGTLTARMEETLGSRIKLGAPVESIERKKDGTFKVKIEGQYLPIDATAIIVATPSHASAKILKNIMPEISAPLAAIPYAPVAVVYMSFDSNDLGRPIDGIGVWVPRPSDVRITSSIVSSNVFPVRAPSSETLITSYVGGMFDEEAMELNDDELIKEVGSGLKTIFDINAAPKFVFVKRWNQAMPVFSMGHLDRRREILTKMSNEQGIFLIGGYLSLGGVSIANTIFNARGGVEAVLSYIKPRLQNQQRKLFSL